MRTAGKAESAILHLALSVMLIVALVVISIPVAAAQMIFAPKLLKIAAGPAADGETAPGID